MIYIGIDPGKSGSIAVLNDEEVILHKMPEDPFEIMNILNEYSGKECFCVLERVHGMPGMGGAQMFTFGKNYGHIEMALFASKIPFITVTPQKWMKSFQITSKKTGETKSQWKNRLKSFSCGLFPKEKITLQFSDALLIAEYCRRFKK